MPTTRAQASGKTQPRSSGAKAGEKRPRAEKGRKASAKKAKLDKEEDVSARKEEDGEKAEEKEAETEVKEKEPEPEKATEVDGTEEKAESKAQNGTVEGPKEKEAETEISGTAEPKNFEKGDGILERGHIYFFYRPKVQLTEATSIDEVSKFSILLLPRNELSTEPKDKSNKRYRYIEVGKKRLPNPQGHHEVFWAAVIGYGTQLNELTEQLGEKSYDTKTRGERHIAEARLSGRGTYAIYARTDAVPSKRNTYLAYHLSHPSNIGSVQKELDIYPSSSFIIQVRNPTASAAPQAGLAPEKRADYPDEVIQEEFGGKGDKEGRKFSPANPVHLLDFKGAELLLISDKTKIDEVVGEGASRELEKAANKDSSTLSSEDVMRELVMDAEKFPAEALEGEWA